MKTLKRTGGEVVGRGDYWNFSTGERIHVDRETVLPGDGKTTYYKASPIVVLLMGPILGLLYAAFLPFIGLAMAGKLIIEKALVLTLGPIRQVAAFNWSPVAAYFTGRKKAGKKQGGTETEGESREK